MQKYQLLTYNLIQSKTKFEEVVFEQEGDNTNSKSFENREKNFLAWSI